VTSVRESTGLQQQAPVQGRSQPDSRRWHIVPVLTVCAVQAGLSLSLVWSNTAFSDEADYLWVGRLLLAHWLHGTSWPSGYADATLSGSPVIYPPLGAVADSIGGLAGARILSLVFMLAATVLLYLTATRLIGRTGALFAIALWAFSEPVIRLAFATFDPLSILLTALSAWLAVQAACRRFSLGFVATAALALALSTAAAYSALVMVPVVIAFACTIWLMRMRVKRAVLQTMCFVVCYTALFAALIAVSHSVTGLMTTVINRSVTLHQSFLLVVNDTWTYSGLVLCLAVVGAIVAVAAEGWRAALIVVLCCAALVAPIAQLHDQTGVSLDKHLAYGIWFAAIAAGYAVSRLIRWLRGASRQLACACCVVALIYPAATSWGSAWQVYHAWANASSFISTFRPVATQASGLIYAAAQDHVAEYYTALGSDWARWNPKLSLVPSNQTASTLETYYAAQLKGGKYGVIALFYPTTFSSAEPVNILLSLPKLAGGGLLNLIGNGAGQPGLAALTHALQSDPRYRLVAQGPFYSDLNYGVYAIWVRA
jgi:hypothetical protein